jgi:hypothetical protein
MTIRLEFLNLINPIRVIEEKYPGGWQTYLEWLGDPSECACWHDEHIFREGAMSSEDIESMIGWWEEKGLIPFEIRNNKTVWKDMCVVASPFGEMQYRCDWLEISEDGYSAEYISTQT